jgi:hypothetical protein
MSKQTLTDFSLQIFFRFHSSTDRNLRNFLNTFPMIVNQCLVLVAAATVPERRTPLWY